MTLSQFLHKLRSCAVGRFLPLACESREPSLEAPPSYWVGWGGELLLREWLQFPGLQLPLLGVWGECSVGERMLPGTLISFYR